jgi:signal transduction histidine kinase/CheY-like chemotaxis protein
MSYLKSVAEESNLQAHRPEDVTGAALEQIQLFRFVVDSVGDAIMVSGQKGQLLFFNGAAEWLLKTEGDGNKTWAENYQLIVPETASPCPSDQHPLERAGRGEIVAAKEFLLRFPGKPEDIRVAITARSLRDEDGTIRAGVTIVRDLTAANHPAQEHKLAEEAVEKANRAKSEFLYRLSHQLRSPLTSILGFSQILSLDGLTAPQRSNVQHILAGGYQLVELLDEVVDLARIDSGALSISNEPVRIREALKNAIELVQPLAKEKNVNIGSELPIPCDRHVRADRQRLKKILFDLISNAIKLNRDGGSVVFSCRETPAHRIRVEVSESGYELAPNISEALFESFDQPGVIADKPGINWLAWMLSKRIVQAMGGNIGAFTIAERGSTFFVELPLIEDPLDRWEGDGAAMLALARSVPQPKQGTVLYVEDNPSNLKLIEELVGLRPGVRLLTAIHAKAGLEFAREHIPDWILLDLHLPDMTGEEVLRELRADTRTSHIPVTVLSGDAAPEHISGLIAAGAREYWTKPLDIRKMLALLERVGGHSEVSVET